MNPRFSSSCFSAVSNAHNARARLILARHVSPLPICTRRANSTQVDHKTSTELLRPERSALLAVLRRDQADRINPARSTRPPALELPVNRSGNIVMHWIRIGRAYGRFYVSGVKAVWFNYQAVQALKKLAPKEGEETLRLPGVGKIKVALSRAEYQLVHRNSHDIGKLPFFGLLVAIFGEWLPLLVPFMPGVVPGTCRIPKQVAQMREKAEKRRMVSFRQGISEPSEKDLPDVMANSPVEEKGLPWPLAESSYCAQLLARLRDDQLHHLSSTLNLHANLWDRIQQRPPSFHLRRKISQRLAYLTGDDLLLAQDGGVEKLSPVELEIACESRGIDVAGRNHARLQTDLAWWLEQQREDKGRGKAMLTMLFRRPNAWISTVGDKKG